MSASRSGQLDGRTFSPRLLRLVKTTKTGGSDSGVMRGKSVASYSGSKQIRMLKRAPQSRVRVSRVGLSTGGPKQCIPAGIGALWLSVLRVGALVRRLQVGRLLR
jgi:hypothetical protein